MTPNEIAEKAYNSIAEEGDPAFNELNKSVLSQYLETAEKGGDASVFGQAVKKVIKQAILANDEEEEIYRAGTRQFPDDVKGLPAGEVLDASDLQEAVDDAAIATFLPSVENDLDIQESELAAPVTLSPDTVIDLPEDSNAEITEEKETESSENVAESQENSEEVHAAEFEELATEEHVRADLKAKTVPELKQLAKDFDIQLPRNAREDKIIDIIVANVGTAEVMAKLHKNEDAK